jgi:hypothetical protein
MSLQHANLPVEFFNAPNIRFWLWGSNFDEEEFREEWLNNKSSWLRNLPGRVEGGIDAMVKEARGWYQHGI